jgi:hypothetical protein
MAAAFRREQAGTAVVRRASGLALIALVACTRLPHQSAPAAPAKTIAPAPGPAAPPAAPRRAVLYVKIPGPISDEARDRRYADPVDAFMRARNLGSVTGWGGMLEGEYLGFDVEVTDLDKALPALRAKLPGRPSPFFAGVLRRSAPLE